MLFNVKLPLNEISDIKPILQTPLGDINFDYHVKDVMRDVLIKRFALNDKATLTRYENDIYELEMIVNEVELPIHVDKTVGVVWRFRLKQPVSRLTFQSAFLHSSVGKVYDGKDHGDDLYALKWHNEKHQLHIGTHDLEFLHERMMHNDYLPVHYDLQSPFYEDEFGLSIILENIEVGKIGQVQFVVSYAPYEPNNLSTWFAVDLSTKNILPLEVEY